MPEVTLCPQVGQKTEEDPRSVRDSWKKLVPSDREVNPTPYSEDLFKVQHQELV